MKRLAGWFAVGGLLALGGCKPLMMDAEEKINAAMPMASAQQDLVAQLQKRAPDAQRKTVEGELAARLKLRALTCAKGYAPSRLTDLDTVRARFADRACFDDEDSAVAEWAGRRLAGVMLAEAPLKPVPAGAPKFIIADSPVSGAMFARDAGVVLVQTQQSLQILDLASGKTMFSEPRSQVQLGSISPNGRLFTTSADYNRVMVRSAESGAVLAQLPKARANSLRWLGASAALYNADDNKVMLLDLVTGKATQVAGIEGPYTWVQAANREETEFVAGTYRTTLRFALERSGGDAHVRLLDERNLPTRMSASNMAGVNAGRTFWFEVGGDMTLTSLDTLKQEKIGFSPFIIQSAAPGPGADTLLLSGFVAGVVKPGLFVYSVGERTIARVDMESLLSTNLAYIPSIKKHAVLAGAKIIVPDALPAAAPVPLARFLADAVQESNAARLAQFGQLDAGQSGSMMIGSAAEIPGMTAGPAAAPMYGDLAKDAQVEAVGVYESAQPRASGTHPEGRIEVRVKASSRPTLLVLSSYESIHWDLRLEPGARLAAVLVSSYLPSRVSGNGRARVVVSNGTYAYNMETPEYARLSANVRRLTGKPIQRFQGTYAGRAFTVGE